MVSYTVLGADQVRSCQISILDTLHVSFMCHTLYYYLVTNYGVPTSLEYIVWSYPVRTPTLLQSTDLFDWPSVCRHGVRWLVTALI
ncbi:hypothetical protein EDD17DRAFT_1671332, partial [Pisolithus thermaeus]